MSPLNRVFRYSNLYPHIGVEDPLVEGGDKHQESRDCSLVFSKLL
jgi:hypothetical protein